MKDIFVIVPTLNPNVEIFESFLNKLKKEFKNILVYDDGCRSEYQDFFKKLEKDNIIVLHHYVNLGKGRAMKDAFNYLLNEYPNIKGVVTADSDGQHSVNDIKKCAELILKNPESLILGCRNFDNDNVPKRNKFGNKTTRGVLKLFVGIKVTDTQTGLRGLPKNVMVKFIITKGDRFEYETNQLIDTISKDVNIKEFEIETIYLDNSNAESHFNPIKDSIAIYKVFLKYIVASFSSFLIDIILFSLFSKIINLEFNILLATILARVMSSIYNYFINSNLVFKSKNGSSFIKYALLVIIQMLLSGFSVQYLDSISKLNTIVIKLFVEIIIFIANFVIQREIIFKGDKDEK